jgi:GNAT superfamily N-acetyltransferase
MYMKYAIENISDVREEMEPLTVVHWLELANDQEEIELDFDWQLYENLQALGKLLFVTVRDDGILVGYSATLITNHMHYKSVLHGLTDFYYIHPRWRRGFVGINLLKFVEAEMKKLGVKKIVTGCKDKHDTSVLLRRLGYKLSDRIFTKVLD